MGKIWNELHKDENWIPWNPLNILGCQAFSVEIKQTDCGTDFWVKCENQTVSLLFEGNVPMYVYSDEGIRMASYAPVQEKNNDKYYFRKWFLYKIENSDFIKWSIQESCGLCEIYGLQHFCIVTQNEVVDILSSVEPTIKIMPKA